VVRQAHHPERSRRKIVSGAAEPRLRAGAFLALRLAQGEMSSNYPKNTEPRDSEAILRESRDEIPLRNYLGI